MTAPPHPAEQRPRFIAEVSSNHACDLDRCVAFIRAAADSGCDAVKFQLFKIDQLFAPEVLAASAEHRARKDWELPVAFLPDLAAACRDAGVAFGCTPFYLDAVAELEPHVDFYKVASYEMIWDDLIRACSETGKPVIVSSGMADLAEVEHAVAVARAAGAADLSLMHCVSAYPTPPEDCNLAAIGTMRDATGCPVGWSDHTVAPAVLFRAVHRWGANAVEFHLDLEGEGAEFAAGHCWLPHTIAPVIQAIRDGIAADGDGVKRPVDAERADRAWRADPSDGLRPVKATRETLS
jgi:sialic acid synthase SpsE